MIISKASDEIPLNISRSMMKKFFFLLYSTSITFQSGKIPLFLSQNVSIFFHQQWNENK